jgi:hypothetical protein
VLLVFFLLRLIVFLFVIFSVIICLIVDFFLKPGWQSRTGVLFVPEKPTYVLVLGSRGTHLNTE